MMKQIPLNTLRFFEAAARLGSFVKAAEELSVTHGAVSRQIRLLEQSLGTSLFERRNRGAFLTPSGRQLLFTVQQVFERLDTTLDALRKTTFQAPLVVSCEPTIAMKWLIPRLNNFYRQYPNVQLHIFASGGPVAFLRDGVDVALRRNDFHWDVSIHAKKVCDEWIAPVCAPTLLKRGQLPLPLQKILHTSSRMTAWENWRSVSKTDTGHGNSQTYEHFYLSLQAACAGLGVAIGSVFMTQEEMDSKLLVAPFGFIRDGSAYYLLSPLPFERDPRCVAFLQWIRQNMQYPSLDA